MFWNSALITPLMMICIYYGIPKANATKKSGEAPSFAGFLYASTGLAMLLVACEQGKGSTGGAPGYLTHCSPGGRSSYCARCFIGYAVRIHWWRLPYLLKWNTVLLGSLLFWFRFTLCTTIILVPQALAIAVSNPNRLDLRSSGALSHLFPSRSRLHFLLLRKFDPRLLLAIGLACTAFAAWLNSQYSSTWSAENFYRTEAAHRRRAGVCFHRTCRLHRAASDLRGGLWPHLSGSLPFRLSFTPSVYSAAPQALSTWAIFWRNAKSCTRTCLGLHVSNGDWLTDQNIHAMTAGLYAKSSGLVTAGARAVDLIAASHASSGISLSIIDGFLLIAWSCVCALILVALVAQITVELRRPQHGPADHRPSRRSRNNETKSNSSADGGGVVLLSYLGRRNKRQRAFTPHYAS